MGLQGGNMIKVKFSNRSSILQLLHEQGSMSRKRIASMLGLTPATITLIVSNLINEGLLAEIGELPSIGNIGRKEIEVGIRADSYHVAGIAIDIDNAYISILDMEGSVIIGKEVHFKSERPSEETVQFLSDCLMELIHDNKIEKAKILGLGVTVRGLVDRSKSKSVASFDALYDMDVPLKDMFHEATGFRVVLENNVRSLFAAHIFRSRSQKYSSQLFVRCEYGIGAALTINHKIWNGSSGKCGELGHTPIVRVGGKLCKCGKTGCLETVASPMAIREDVMAIYSEMETPLLYSITKGAEKEDVTIEAILEAACRGDKRVAGIVDHAVIALCDAMKTVMYTVDPERVIFYGKIFENVYYFAKILAELKGGFLKDDGPIIEKSEYNLKLEECAAGILVIDDFFRNGAMFTTGN